MEKITKQKLNKIINEIRENIVVSFMFKLRYGQIINNCFYKHFNDSVMQANNVADCHFSDDKVDDFMIVLFKLLYADKDVYELWYSYSHTLYAYYKKINGENETIRNKCIDELKILINSN